MAGSAIGMVRAAVLVAVATAHASDLAAPAVLQVIDGTRTPFTMADVVVVADMGPAEVRWAGISPSRQRDEFHEIDLIWSCTRAAGTADAQSVVNVRAAALYAVFDAWLITAPNETLGISSSTQTWSWLDQPEMVEALDPELLATGRNATLRARLHVRVRI